MLAAHGVAGFIGHPLHRLLRPGSWNGVSDGLVYGNAAQLGDQALAALAGSRVRVRGDVRAAEGRSALVHAAARERARGGARPGRHAARRGGLRDRRGRDPRHDGGGHRRAGAGARSPASPRSPLLVLGGDQHQAAVDHAAYMVPAWLRPTSPSCAVSAFSSPARRAGSARRSRSGSPHTARGLRSSASSPRRWRRSRRAAVTIRSSRSATCRTASRSRRPSTRPRRRSVGSTWWSPTPGSRPAGRCARRTCARGSG